jgi:hypothetical protein
LWEHEVVKVFLVGKPHLGKSTPYLEVEVGPYGHFLALRLESKFGIKQIMEKHLPITVTAERKRIAGMWTAHVVIADQFVPSGMLMVNAYVVHGQGRYLTNIIVTSL